MALCNRLVHFLDREQVHYEVLPHAQVFTAQEVAAASHVSGWHLAKVLMLRDGGGGFHMAVIPAPARVDLEALERASGARRLRLAREDEFLALFPDCETGTMPPFGNLYGIPLYVDVSLSAAEEFIFQGGSHEEVVRMRWADYERLERPALGDFCLHGALAGGGP